MSRFRTWAGNIAVAIHLIFMLLWAIFVGLAVLSGGRLPAWIIEHVLGLGLY